MMPHNAKLHSVRNKRQRGGQPRADEPTTRMLRVRLTEDEWMALELRAERANVSISEYVRSKVFG